MNFEDEKKEPNTGENDVRTDVDSAKNDDLTECIKDKYPQEEKLGKQHQYDIQSEHQRRGIPDEAQPQFQVLLPFK